MASQDLSLKIVDGLSSYKSFFQKLLLLSITFPHITFGLVPAETAPFPLVIALILIILEKKINSFFVYSNFILLLFWSITIPQGINILDGVEQLFVYLQNIYVAFYIYKCGLPSISQSFCLSLIGFHLMTGIAYTIGIDFFNNILVFLSSERLGAEISRGQGSRFFSTEPSEAMGSLFLVLILYSLNRFKFFNFVVFFTLLVTAILSSSGTSFLLISIFLFSFFLIKYRLTGLLLLIFSIFCISFVLNNFLFDIAIDNRVLNLVRVAMSLGFLDLMNFINISSGFRFTLDMASFFSIFNLMPFYGIGSASSNSLFALTSYGVDLQNFSEFNYVDITNLKPTSLVATILIEFGILGLGFLLFFLVKMRRYLIFMFSNQFTNSERSILIVVIFKLFFLMIVGTPASIATVFLAFYYINLKKIETSRTIE